MEATGVSTEIHLGSVTLPIADYLDFPEFGDQVLHTADDRPNTDTLPILSDPAADHLDAAVAVRRADIEEKHRRVSSFLDQNGLDALILGRADSLSWFTSGGDLSQSNLSGDAGSVYLFVNRTSRAIICDNVHSARVFEEELAGLGFQLKERQWYEDPTRILLELGHNKKIATDGHIAGTHWPDFLSAVRLIRSSLTC